MMKKKRYSLIAAMILLAVSGGAAHASTMLDTVYVYGDKDREEIQPMAGGAVNTAYGAGVMGNQKLHDIPFTVVSMTKKTIENYSDPTQPLPSVLVNNPSVRSTASTFYDDFSIRGIKLSGYQLYLNGIPGLFEQGTTPTNFLSRIDVTSGPAMTVNLATAAESTGGLVNMVSKKAESRSQTDVTMAFSGRSTFTRQIDIGRRFGKNREWGIRVNALHSNGQTSIPEERKRSRNVFVNIDHESRNSSTNLLVGYVDDSVRNSLRWFTFDTDLTYTPSAPDIHKNYGFKVHKWEADKWIATLNHEQKMSKNWMVFLNAGYGKYDIYNASNSSWRYTIHEDGSFEDKTVRNPFAYDNRTVQLGIRGKAVKGDVTHNLVFAVEKYWQKFYGSTSWAFGTISGNLTDGITSQPDHVPAYPYRKPYLKAKTTYTSWKAIDNMEIGKFNILTGVVKKEVSNRSTGSDDVRSDAVSPLYGIVYKPNEQLSFYASHSESFGRGSVITGARYDNAGQILAPAKTRQNEIGIRYNNGKILTNLSAFKITMANAMDVPTGTAGRYNKTNDGEVNYTGVDWSLFGKIHDKWNITGGIMYVKAETDKSTGGVLDGIRKSGVPEWSGVIGLEFNPTDSLSFLARAVYSGSYYIRNQKYKLPSYTTFDFGVKYKVSFGDMPVTFHAMVYNAFDKAYWESLPGGDNLILSMPRTFMLSAALSF